MSRETAGLPGNVSPEPSLSPGRLAQVACLLEVTARKPGNVHRFADFADLHFVDFLLSATAIAEPLDRAPADGLGPAVLGAIEATRRVVSTNTPTSGSSCSWRPSRPFPGVLSWQRGLKPSWPRPTVDDAKQVYRAIRLAQPGGMGEVPDQDITAEPTITLREAMALAAERDSIARQYANGFREVLGAALPVLRESLHAGQPLETAVVAAYLHVLAHHPDSLIARKYGLARASEVSRRAAGLIDAGWPEREEARTLGAEFDRWLRQASNRFNPGTTADLVTAAVYAALRDGTIPLPLAKRRCERHDGEGRITREVDTGRRVDQGSGQRPDTTDEIRPGSPLRSPASRVMIPTRLPGSAIVRSEAG